MPQTRAPAPNRFPSFPSRREFLHASAGAGLMGGLGGIGSLGRALAGEATLGHDLVRLSADLEPIVRVIEETPREKVIEAAAELLRSGVGYRPFMAALYLAGIRNVDSSTSGSRFHCVYVINSAHLLALEAPPQERLLPFFWALDEFKVAQAALARPMRPLTGRTPTGSEAITALRAAVDEWDGCAAERALAGMARTCGAAEAFEELWRLGARDMRPIGHKAIFVANTWRTLHAIGWHHAEPAFRSLAYSLAGYGRGTLSHGFHFENQCHRENEELVRANVSRLPRDWADESTPAAGADAALAAALLAPIRASKDKAACRETVELLVASKARAGAIWDAVHLAAAEFILRRRGILAVHAVTSVNALHFAFRMARTPEARLFVLLQAVGWMSHFAWPLGVENGTAGGPSILDLEAAEVPDKADAAAESVLASGGDWQAMARRAFGYAKRHGGERALFSAARRLVFTRASESHEYKYPAAAFEDIPAVSAAWQPHMLAASTLYLPSMDSPESPVIRRAKEAVAGL